MRSWKKPRFGSRRLKNAVAAGSGVLVHGGESGRIFSGGDVSCAVCLSALSLWPGAAAVVGSRVAGSPIAAAGPHLTCRFSPDLRRASCDSDAPARVAVYRSASCASIDAKCWRAGSDVASAAEDDSGWHRRCGGFGLGGAVI